MKKLCYIYWTFSIIFLSKKLNISDAEPASKLRFINKSKTTENNHMPVWEVLLLICGFS